METPDLRQPYQMGHNPDMDAWYIAFFLENHLDYFAYPKDVATPEQVGFMVYTENEERFYPCSDRTFDAIMSKHGSDYLQTRYQQIFQTIIDLVDQQLEDEHEKSYLKSLLRIKFIHETRDEIMIPSRLEKRLLQIYINRTQIEDPYITEKSKRNRRAVEVLNSKELNQALNYFDLANHSEEIPSKLNQIRKHLEYIELKRLIALTGQSGLWTSEAEYPVTAEEYIKYFNTPLKGEGAALFFEFIGIRKPGQDTSHSTRGKKILWLVNECGEIIFDLAIIKYLARMGHRIVIAFKGGPLFHCADIFDVEEDPVLQKELESATIVKNKILSKNELIKLLKSSQHIMVISDGTRETLNLMLTSVSFSRLFKEVDGVISRGIRQRRRFFETHFEFTQDIFNISTEADGSISILYRPRHSAVRKFSHEDLEQKAKIIIHQMIEARNQGMTVIFYSGIIGSIPNRIDMAKKIMSVFIDSLQESFSHAFIINPSDYYESGMDADDLMYMWEIVQRSGYIDIWRFQTYEDIAHAFSLMQKKVPPEWIGKDATYSTGCTKEIKIALEVQQLHPEMQLIAPPKEKFFRRKEYGIGKMYDRRFSDRGNDS
jgi:uncharacterized protein with ATP-grasp and redox domains